MTQHYNLEDYNQDNVLKAPLWLKLGLVYQAKYFLILVLLPAISILPIVGQSVTVVMPYVQSFSQHHANLLLLLPTIPALFVAVALIRRTSKTQSQFIRRVWRQGRQLMIGSVLLELVLLGALILVGAKQISELLLVIMYLNAMVLFYLFRSQRIKHVFAEFPLTDADAWEHAKTEDTLQGYRKYLRTRTNKSHEIEAARKIDQILWQWAIERDDIEGYQTYLEEGIKGKKHGVEARQKLRALNEAMQATRQSTQA